MTSQKKCEDSINSLKKLLQLECNKSCFECMQRGPTYVNVTIGAFVCTTCCGLLRGLSSPHRVKSISMSSFTSTEVALVESRGNEYCQYIYLGKYDDKCQAKPDTRDRDKLKIFMEQKYIQKRWYTSPEEASKPLESFMQSAVKNNADCNCSSAGSNSRTSIRSAQVPKQKLVEINKQSLSTSDNDIAVSNVNPTMHTNSDFADFTNAFPPQLPNNFCSNLVNPANFEEPSSVTTGFGDFSAKGHPAVTSSYGGQKPAENEKPPDKYANLDDLFSIDNCDTSKATAVWDGHENSSINNSLNNLANVPFNPQLQQSVPNNWQATPYVNNVNPFITNQASPELGNNGNALYSQPIVYCTNQPVFSTAPHASFSSINTAVAMQPSVLPNMQPVNSTPLSGTTQSYGMGFSSTNTAVAMQPSTATQPYGMGFSSTNTAVTMQPSSVFSNMKPVNNTPLSTVPQPYGMGVDNFANTRPVMTNPFGQMINSSQPPINHTYPYMAQQPISAQSSVTNPFAIYQAQLPANQSSNPFLQM